MLSEKSSRLNQEIKSLILGLPLPAKIGLVVTSDLILCFFSVWLSYYLRLGEFVPMTQRILYPVLISIGLLIPIFIFAGLYRAIFRYSGSPVLLSVIRSMLIYGSVYAGIFTLVGVDSVPRTLGLIQPILLALFVSITRIIAGIWLGRVLRASEKKVLRRNTLIYGAGDAGLQLAKSLSDSAVMRVVGFLDDDFKLHGRTLNSLPVYIPKELPRLVDVLSVRDVLLAMPNISRHSRNEIIENIRALPVSVRTLPSMNELAKGSVDITDIRDLDLNDLLGRDVVEPKMELLNKNIFGKVVLVTGAGGSIGSELSRQIVKLKPSKLLLFEQSEFALYVIQQELEGISDVAVISILGSVQDEERVGNVMRAWLPNTVYHAAAYKHVPLVEHNPGDGVKNNVFGTLCMAQAAIDNNTENFVLISTDKAVRPTSIMGASKRLAEMILQALDEKAFSTRFSMVRFGNVLGSSGSVVPKFRQQIKNGGPVTLTHEAVTRYFMTVSEAAQLVIQAGALAAGGDVFVLDMGRPVKIMDLATRMIDLSGLTIKDALNPQGEIEIEITGLRPGEKLFEELIIGETTEQTINPRILKAHESFIPWLNLAPHLEELKLTLSNAHLTSIKTNLKKLVVGYLPDQLD